MRNAWVAVTICVVGCTSMIPVPDGAVGPDAGSEGGGDGGCTRDAECGVGLSCVVTTGECRALGCLAAGCPAGERCESQTGRCVALQPGPQRRYEARTLAGHAISSHFATRDAVGPAAFGDFDLLVASRNGRYVYGVDEAVVMRIDVTSGRVETLSGIGWPGEVDGPAGVAQFESNFYQSGGIALSPDQRSLIFTSPRSIRRVDTETGEASSMVRPFGRSLRTLAVGRDTGNVYVTDFAPSSLDVIFPDGGVEARPLYHRDAGGPIGYLVVDERRGLAYGLDRNRASGALYRWSIDGGAIDWLNYRATGARDPIQYLSDGPVAHLEMANPAGLSIDAEGFVYIGAGDGRTFRRFDPDREVVESLCRVPADAGDQFEWCFGDGVRNRPFGTWPSILAFDDSGNGFFGYSVWPRLIMLRRQE